MGSWFSGLRNAREKPAIRTSSSVAEPKVEKRRRLHLDLLGTEPEIRKNLSGLSRKLERKIPLSKTKVSMTLSSDSEYRAKFSEMMGEKLPFRITQKAESHSPGGTAHAAWQIVNLLDVITSSTRLGQFVLFDFNRPDIELNGTGIIPRSSNGQLVGREVLEFVACNVHEDFGIVLANGGRLVYDFDSAMFEKTPKDPRTGENFFLGKDFISFHGAAKRFGDLLPAIFGKMMNAFSDGRLDVLTIDLRGANVFSNGKLDVRRFERDHVVPIWGNNGVEGILVFTDVFFQRENYMVSPFAGGEFLGIDCPIKFATEFRVKG